MLRSETPALRFDDCEIDPAAFELRRAGRVCALEPQVLELLLYLARRPGRLITKDDLIRDVWGGRIVSDSTLASRIKSARRAIGDDGTQQRRIRTVHGRGVKFVGEGPAAEPAAAPEQDWPSIAVLPFANLSGDPEQGFFADGVTEDIITDLSRFREQRVVARDSAFRYRDVGGDPQRVGRALGAEYIVTGSIRRQGTKLRLTAQLTDAASGTQLWAERFDRDAEDIFAVSDAVVATIAATLAGRVREVGSARAKRKPPANLIAYECLLRGQAALHRMGDQHEEAMARRFFEQALESDPDYARAHSGLAIVLLREWFRDPCSTDDALDPALAHARRAVALDSEDYECQETLGWVLLHRKCFDQAEQQYRRALALNPNSPDELAAMGAACGFLGQPEEAIGWFERARRVDPYFEPTWYWHLQVAALFNARRYDDAIAAFGRCSDTPAWAVAYAAASHAMAGRAAAARDAAAGLMAAWPDFSAAALVRKEPFRIARDRDHLVEGLRGAGLVPPAAM
jgi:TolB-like protein/tetratricopeptide (TPR) repeat protein